MNVAAVQNSTMLFSFGANTQSASVKSMSSAKISTNSKISTKSTKAGNFSSTLQKAQNQSAETKIDQPVKNQPADQKSADTVDQNQPEQLDNSQEQAEPKDLKSLDDSKDQTDSKKSTASEKTDDAAKSPAETEEPITQDAPLNFKDER